MTPASICKVCQQICLGESELQERKQRAEHMTSCDQLRLHRCWFSTAVPTTVPFDWDASWLLTCTVHLSLYPYALSSWEHAVLDMTSHVLEHKVIHKTEYWETSGKLAWRLQHNLDVGSKTTANSSFLVLLIQFTTLRIQKISRE